MMVCRQTIPMKYHTFFLKLGKMSRNLSSAAVMIGPLRVNVLEIHIKVATRSESTLIRWKIKFRIAIVTSFLINLEPWALLHHWPGRHYIIYSHKKETSDFHGTVSFDPAKMLQQK